MREAAEVMDCSEMRYAQIGIWHAKAVEANSRPKTAARSLTAKRRQTRAASLRFFLVPSIVATWVLARWLETSCGLG